MKAKLLAVWAKVQPWLAKAYGWSPLACGIAIGYFGHGMIKAGVDAAVQIVKTILKI